MITPVDQILGFIVAFQSIFELKHFLIYETNAYPRLNFSTVNIQDFGKALQGRIVIPHQLIGNADTIPGFNIRFIKSQNLFKIPDCPFILLQFLQRNGNTQQCLGVFGVNLIGLL